jgi:hypothetical protein
MENDGVCDDEFLDKIYETFDGFLALDFMGIAKLNKDLMEDQNEKSNIRN